jgi:hypothetical protein
MSTFIIGGTTLTFTALEEGFTLEDVGAVERLRLSVWLADAAAWGALWSLRSWAVGVEDLADPTGGTNAHIDYLGAGPGTLTVDEADIGWSGAKIALLHDPKQSPPAPDGQRQATVTFTVVEDA